MRRLSLDVELDDAQVERLVAAIKGNSGRMYISIEERDALHAIIGPITVTLHDEEFDVEHAVRIIDGVAS